TEFASPSSQKKPALPVEAMAATASPATPQPKEAASRPIVDSTEPSSKVPKEDPWLGQVMGNFRLTKLLGVGGMGAVYLAEHRVLPKRAAVKLLKRELAAIPEVAMRFQREAEAATGIAHENVVQIFDFGQRDDGTVYLIMELLEGKSLASLLKEEGPLSPERIGEILRPICLGLAAAHEKGIVHRDLKPDNIFLSRQP